MRFTSLVETDGAGDMGAIIKLFGQNGFRIPISLLIDKDASAATAAKLGVEEKDLEQNSVFISHPDLEAEYVAALGAATVWAAIETSALFSANERSNCTPTGPGGTRSADDVAAFCRRKSTYKVRAALVVSPLFDATTAAAGGSIDRLLAEVATS